MRDDLMPYHKIMTNYYEIGKIGLDKSLVISQLDYIMENECIKKSEKRFLDNLQMKKYSYTNRIQLQYVFNKFMSIERIA